MINVKSQGSVLSTAMLKVWWNLLLLLYYKFTAEFS